MTEDKCLECNAPIPDGGTWGYCKDCWDDDLLPLTDNEENDDERS